jgi:hypothetical protein
MAQGRTRLSGVVAALGAAALLAACFVSADQKKSLTCDEAAARGYICEPSAGAAGAGGTPLNGAGGAGGAGGSAGAGAGGSGAGGLGGGGSGGAGGSGGLVCQAPAIDCDGACIDIAKNDAANCGACGYACEAGRLCTAGVCAPLPVVSGVVAPYALALDAANVYFTVPVKGPGDLVPPAVQKVARGGGTATPVFAGSIFRSRSVALLDGTLYFGDLDTNGRILKGATTGDLPQIHLTDQPAVQQLAAADSRLWWSLFDGGTSRVRREPGAGGGGAAGGSGFEELLPSVVGNRHFGRITALAVEGTGGQAVAYWVNPVDSDAGLWRKADGTDAEKLVPGADMVALAVGTDGLYVAQRGAGIGKVAKGPAAPATEQTGAARASAVGTEVVSESAVGGTVQGLAVTTTHLYWLAFNAGQLELHRSALDGTEARVLGRVVVALPTYWAAPIGPSQLVVDGGHVYFSDVGSVTGNTQDDNLDGVVGAADGAIYRLPQ